MGNSPRISVIMPIYQGGHFLSKAIDSILNQTYPDFELLFICDDPLDQTLALLNAYAHTDTRVKIHVNEIRLGLVASRNKGCRLAVGEFLNQMDSDDISDLQRFKKQVEFLDSHPEIGAVGTGSVYVDESGKVIRKFHTPPLPGVIKWNMFFENILGQSTVLIRKELIQKIRYYNERYSVSEDYDLWIRVFAISKISIIPETLLHYRIHKDNISRSAEEQIRMFSTEINRHLVSYELKDLSNNDLDLWKHYFLKEDLTKKEEIEQLGQILKKLYYHYITGTCLNSQEREVISHDMGIRYAMLAYVSKKVSFFLVIKYLMVALRFDRLISFKLIISVIGRYRELQYRNNE